MIYQYYVAKSLQMYYNGLVVNSTFFWRSFFMLKRISVILLCLCLAFCAGCSKAEDLTVEKGEDTDITGSQEPVNTNVINSLTGVQDLAPSKENARPVAVMIDNDSLAQKVQTGVGKADIVYETEVEGGITRLMAVFKDFSSVKQIGNIRSARYPYIELALGHNAIYLHHGQDNTYAGPHLSDIAHLTVSENNGGERIDNTAAGWQNLYGYPDKLWNTLVKNNYKTTVSDNTPWQSFTDGVVLENAASTVTVGFSRSYITKFVYDQTSGNYIRNNDKYEHKDYMTNERIEFKNVFVLKTTIRYYPDGKHKEVLLNSGEGYYCVNGTYTPIKWTKGSGSNPLKFTLTDGTPLSVNQGNSWVCIANTSADITLK